MDLLVHRLPYIRNPQAIRVARKAYRYIRDVSRHLARQHRGGLTPPSLGKGSNHMLPTNSWALYCHPRAQRTQSRRLQGAAKARRQAARADILNKEDTDKGEGPSSQPLQEHMEVTLPYGDDDTNIVPSLLRDEDSIMTDVSAGEAPLQLGEHPEPSPVSPMGSRPSPAPYDLQLQQSLQDGEDDTALERHIYGK
jgi:hypothetical protein